ncbi:hypothetical protein HHI36_002924 [Cryptolaemus montrouzieri]|uniref:RNase H type-1 domain-containing protein n=1 Tax=Cryptolaemus montrouzieri TaxID=559131 RepID=A0ABD2PBX3_9CUCU
MSLYPLQTREQSRLRLIWDPGHSGIEENEKADSLAARGTNLKFIGPEPKLGIPLETARMENNRWLDLRVLEYWLSLPGLRHARRAISGPSATKAKAWPKLSRFELRLLTAIITRHCRLRKHLNKLGLVEDPSGRLCEEDIESMEHVLCECPAGDRVRMEDLGSYKLKLTELIKLSPRKLVSFARRMELVDEI